ncbi:MAG TPA: DNA polymerase III subunit beta [Lachnospiraceae bacterium]|nr:DNA polymerase III subunit beta [Lachnospiraceae bacterium]
MKIICTKSDLLKSSNIALRAVPVRSTMPILECILIDVSDNGIKFTTNDMELGIDTCVNGQVIETGIVAVDAKLFSEIIRKLPDSDVTVSSDENYNITILCDKSKFVLSGNSGEDFPFLPAVEKDECISISQFTLRQVIQQTIFSIASNENNKVMTGELFEISGNNFRVISLDGHRISIRRVELKESYENKKVIVPGKTLSEICKILTGEMDDNVSIFIARNHVVFELTDTTVVSRLIEGEYFNVDQMISNDYETKVKIKKQLLTDCIDRATLFVREGDKKPIIIDIQDGRLNLNIDSPFGAMDENIDIEKEGKDLMIGFNPRFMMDALKVIDDEYVTLYFTNPKSPCYIRDEDKNYTYLILPVNFIR